MKLVKYYLESISDVGIYPCISLLIFFFFFLGVILWLIRGNKEYFNQMGSFALDNDEKEDIKESKNSSIKD